MKLWDELWACKEKTKNQEVKETYNIEGKDILSIRH